MLEAMFTSREGRFVIALRTRHFQARRILPRKRSEFMKKKRKKKPKQIFPKIVRASKVTRQRTLTTHNAKAGLDHGRC